MIDLDQLYFEWLLKQLNPDAVREGVAHVCNLLYNCDFKRRVGNDINRAADGARLRRNFFDDYEEADFEPHVVNEFMDRECSWLEMMIALAIKLDFTYENGVEEHFLEMVENMQLGPLLGFNPVRSTTTFEYDQMFVDGVTDDIDNNRFSSDGFGGMFPLRWIPHPDQREVEIWDQLGAYFREKLNDEGVLWTSTS